jgi:hypothetical protein
VAVPLILGNLIIEVEDCRMARLFPHLLTLQMTHGPFCYKHQRQLYRLAIS